MLNVKLQGKRDELIDWRKNLFDKATLKIKEWKANELSFYDSVLKSVTDGINEIDSKIAHTLVFLNGRFPAIVAQRSEDRRIRKRRKDNRNKEIRHAKARLNEGKKKLIKLLLGGRESITITIENLEGFQMEILKPRFHLKPLISVVQDEIFKGEDAKLWAQNAVQYLTDQQAETRENNTLSSEMRKQHKEDEAQQATAFKNYFQKW